MREVVLIERFEQAAMLLKPLRLAVLKQLTEPRSCPELGAALALSPQKIYYHVKELEKAGLVEQVATRPARGITEGIYQATGQSYYLSPGLVGRLGGKSAAAERMSLDFLAQLAQSLLTDAGNLARSGQRVHSLGLEARVELSQPERREEFMAELQQLLKDLARKYGAKRGRRASSETESYRLLLACYPEAAGQQDD